MSSLNRFTIKVILPKKYYAFKGLYYALGHPSTTVAQALNIPHDSKQLLLESSKNCEFCLMTNTTAKRHSLSSPETAACSHPLQLLHVDLHGPVPTTGISQERYYLIIVDGYTKYKPVIPVNTKAETVTHLINFITSAETFISPYGQWRVVIVRSDNGGEFLNRRP